MKIIFRMPWSLTICCCFVENDVKLELSCSQINIIACRNSMSKTPSTGKCFEKVSFWCDSFTVMAFQTSVMHQNDFKVMSNTLWHLNVWWTYLSHLSCPRIYWHLPSCILMGPTFQITHLARHSYRQSQFMGDMICCI